MHDDRAYVLLSGQMPFVWLGSDDYSGLLRRHLSEARRGPRFDTMAWKGQNVSVAAKDFILKMLTVDPERRPATEELLAHEWLIATAAAGEKEEDAGKDSTN